MAKIIFNLVQAAGHINPSLKLARTLKNKGHEVLFTSNQEFREHIIRQGFNVLEISPIEQSKRIDTNNEKNLSNNYSSNNLISVLKKLFIKWATNYLINFYNEKLALKYTSRIVAAQPSLVLVDSMLPLYHTILLKSHNISIINLQTMMSLSMEAGSPPMNSKIIPKKNRGSLIYCEILWIKYFTKRRLRAAWKKAIYLGKDEMSINRRIARKCRFTLRGKVNHRRSFNFALKHVPEIILSSEEFNFFKSKQNRELYIGMSVSSDRREDDINKEISDIIHSKTGRLVYCSLGTISTMHNKRCGLFFNKVIDAFKNSPWTVILSTGNDTDQLNLDHGYGNIHTFCSVPQLSVLKYCDIMITHGGLNSITECIVNEVPMLVYPLNNKWDQNGNAARVVYHHIGLRGGVNLDAPN